MMLNEFKMRNVERMSRTPNNVEHRTYQLYSKAYPLRKKR
jgi:hypothetical protein